MITYEYTDPIKVKLEGKLIGYIKSNGPACYFYETTGGHRGDLYMTIAEVKRSLEKEV